MKMDSDFSELRSIKGYKSNAVLDASGTLLSYHSTDSNTPPETIIEVFNDIFRATNKVASDVGLSAISDLLIKTPSGTIVMKCCTDKSPHLNLITVLESGGNHIVARQIQDEIMTKSVTKVA